jgi:UDP-N-acetylglucosamine diphosphorylase/glucosamine-1-phosphate N-acetyltransferase
MALVFFDDHSWHLLKPLTLTRPVCEIRCGIDTISEKWQHLTGMPVAGYLTAAYLSEKFPAPPSGDYLLVNGSVIPSPELVSMLTELPANHSLVSGETILAARHRMHPDMPEPERNHLLKNLARTECKLPLWRIRHLWDIFSLNGKVMEDDFQRITQGRQSQPLSASNTVAGKGNIFLEEGARAECCIFNPSGGVIYLGKDSEMMEGTVVRGSLAVGEHAQIKLAAKIYGPTTIGPHCRAGGEVNNSVMMAYSNKGHDGFLGNSVIGEWCNLGADTNNSNLKNNYGEVDIYSYPEKKYRGTGLQFCGLFMGDHSKCGINTMFNTGTVVGVSANVFGAGFPPKFIPSFSWGGFDPSVEFRIQKALELAERMMERRHLSLSPEEVAILQHLYAEREAE